MSHAFPHPNHYLQARCLLYTALFEFIIGLLQPPDVFLLYNM